MAWTTSFTRCTGVRFFISALVYGHMTLKGKVSVALSQFAVSDD